MEENEGKDNQYFLTISANTLTRFGLVFKFSPLPHICYLCFARQEQ